MQVWCRLIFFGLLAALGTAATSAMAGPPEYRAKVQQMTEALREAGELYSAEKYTEAAAKVDELQRQLVELMQDGGSDPALQRLVRPVYRRLANAHGMLELEGAELQPLPAWQDLIKSTPAQDAAAGGVSFKRDLAPWIISACGNCHINNRRGQFSMASYEDLIKGPPEGKVLFPGSPSGNRLVEVIESGDMPRGGGTVSPEQLAVLKKWIADGARFDGPNPAAPLMDYVERPQNGNSPRLSANPPTGKETISFSKEIAPVLLENCKGCHINGRQAAGGLRMDDIQQLLQGGDSGSLLDTQTPAESLIVKKLRGTAGGQRMPAGGRPPLPIESINLIENWIREGAVFDGPSPNTNIEIIANRAWAAQANHGELFARRKLQATQKWNQTSPSTQPAIVENDQLILLGNVSPGRLEAIAASVNSAMTKTRKQFGAPENQPLIRGGLAVFVLKNRYDYSEFGRMIENRELPRVWLGHWRANAIDTYAVINGGEELTEDSLDAVALQVTAAAYLASLGDSPYWFAEGVARNLVMTQHRRDPRVKLWQASLPAAGQQVENAQMLTSGRLNEEAAGTVGMALANFMMNRNNRRRFDRLIDLLQENKNFEQALTATFAKPEDLVKMWLGK
jgi:mono/diheme cytochrome c family protein